MAQITFENYHDCYEYGKKIIEGIITKKNAAEKISKNGMSYASAVYYLNCVTAMIEGRMYTATVKKDAIIYFLNEIYSEFGKNGLKKALNSLKLHLQYQKGKNNLPSLEQVYEDFCNIIN
ncbi:MAG: hypothetical protein UHY68_03125 [Acutalibacteraceae bacterium]|nr:hypothetical protein [Acutalibacteraceae bacterium]